MASSQGSPFPHEANDRRSAEEVSAIVPVETLYPPLDRVIAKGARCLMKFLVTLDKVGTTQNCPACEQPLLIAPPKEEGKRVWIAATVIAMTACFVMLGVNLFSSQAANKPFDTGCKGMYIVTT